MTRLEIEFLEKCMPTDNRWAYYVPYSLWNDNLEVIKELQCKGYNLSISQVDSLENIDKVQNPNAKNSIKLIVNYNYINARKSEQIVKQAEIISFDNKDQVTTNAIRKKLRDFHGNTWLNIKTINQIN